jgi:hypothetical protein
VATGMTHALLETTSTFLHCSLLPCDELCSELLGADEYHQQMNSVASVMLLCCLPLPDCKVAYLIYVSSFSEINQSY